MALLALITAGCGQQAQGPETTNLGAADLAIYQARFVLPEEPDGAVGVLTARESSKTDDAVVVVGRIGGTATPWIEGRAAFVMADASTLTESAEHCEEGCTKECCAHLKELKGFTALVKVIDEQGRPLPVGARELLSVTEHDMVVVRGRAQRDDGGNLTILADGVYVRR
jgi:hypothetical protein